MTGFVRPLRLSLVRPLFSGKGGGAVPPVISITSGGGYAGSVYKADKPQGQWYAGEDAIAGATNDTWTMTTALEGAAITYRIGPLVSNAIEMWMPTDLAASYRSNGGWWDPKRSVNVSGGKVTGLVDQFGARNMSQPTGANQPDYAASINGWPAISWPDAENDRHLIPASDFAPAYWAFVMQYGSTGTATLFPNTTGDGDYPSIISNGYGPNRVMGGKNTPDLFSSSVWSAFARKNAPLDNAAISTILPLPKSLVEIGGSPSSASWMIGKSAGASASGLVYTRGWRGPMFEVIALGASPVTDTDTLRRLQGCLAWRNGLQASLPALHPHRNAGPRVQ